MKEPPLFRLERVGKLRRDREAGEVSVLAEVCCDLDEGRITGLIGPSGGGKTTLMRLLNRLEDPSSGRILFRGTDLRELPPLELRRRVAALLQTPHMFPGTVLDNLLLPFRFRDEPPPARESALLQRVLEDCRLGAGLLERPAAALSIGQQQRVALARCLVGQPEVLLLDEPTSALDRPTGDRVATALLDLARQHRLTLLVVTHDLRLASRLADELLFLEEGRLVEQGPARQLLTAPASVALRRFLADPEPAEGERA